VEVRATSWTGRGGETRSRWRAAAVGRGEAGGPWWRPSTKKQGGRDGAGNWTTHDRYQGMARWLAAEGSRGRTRDGGQCPTNLGGHECYPSERIALFRQGKPLPTEVNVTFIRPL
jgi:hypothetical protein